jgi:hypothetical protein
MTASAPLRRFDQSSPAASMASARSVLADARGAGDAGERFVLAHLAALRAAAAVVASRGDAGGGRRRLVSVWILLARVAPELTDWATYFAAGAPIRATVEAGAASAVTPRIAEDQLRSAGDFLDIVAEQIGVLAA